MFRNALIRELREELDQPPEWLGLTIGRSTASVALYESGKVTPRIEVLERIAAALGVSVRDFFEEEAA